MFKENLKRIIEGKDLSEEQMAEMMQEIFSGRATDARIGAMMAALATQADTSTELVGPARAMRRKALRLQVPTSTIVDIVGTAIAIELLQIDKLIVSPLPMGSGWLNCPGRW